MFIYAIDTGIKRKVIIEHINLSDLVELHTFEFDWSKESKYETYKLSLASNRQILGLVSIERIVEELRIEVRLLEISIENVGRRKKYDGIAGILLAFACKESFKSGFYGFVSLIPKTGLINHYKEKYGFKQFGRHMAIELAASELLMKKYLSDEEER